MDSIWATIKEALTSKKFVMAAAGALSGALLKIGLDLPTEDVAAVLSPIIAYIFAQGWADSGKEAAKIDGTVKLAMEGLKPTEAVKEKLL